MVAQNLARQANARQRTRGEPLLLRGGEPGGLALDEFDAARRAAGIAAAGVQNVNLGVLLDGQHEPLSVRNVEGPVSVDREFGHACIVWYGPRYNPESVRSPSPAIVALHVGQPEGLGIEGAADWFDERWTTAIFKRAIVGPIRVTTLGLIGDGQADPANHGGPDKAICVYSADHYPDWQRELGLADFGAGAFGENFTIRGLTEADVCVGDIWTVGDVELQLSQPRQPCWKLAQKWRLKTLSAQTVENGRTGWYFRVLREGLVNTGDRLVLTSRTSPDWTVAAANEVMHHRRHDRNAATTLAAVATLSGSWKHKLQARAASEPGPER